MADGRVLVPPQEYDPLTSDPLDEFVDVNDVGVVTALAKGNADIVAIDLTGSLLSVPAPITVTVP